MIAIPDNHHFEISVPYITVGIREYIVEGATLEEAMQNFNKGNTYDSRDQPVAGYQLNAEAKIGYLEKFERGIQQIDVETLLKNIFEKTQKAA